MAGVAVDESDPEVKDLLTQKVRLDNGEEGYIFTYEKGVGGNRGRFFCCVCSSVLCSAQTLVQHVEGKNHVRKMQTHFHPHEKFKKMALKEYKKTGGDAGLVVTAPGVDMVDLAPGEPVPPGFEDVVMRVPEIMSRLDKMKSPLIGLEYLAEVIPKPYEAECSYVCLLCDKKGDKRTVPAHLVSFSHRYNYLSLYFPRTKQLFAELPRLPTYRRGISECLAKIAEAIEKKFGRLTPIITNHEKDKGELHREIADGRHFHETSDTTLSALVDLEFIQEIVLDPYKRLTVDFEKDEAKLLSALKDTVNQPEENTEEPIEEKPEMRSVVEIEKAKEVERKGITRKPFESKEPPSRSIRGRSPSRSRSNSPVSLTSSSRSRSPRRPKRRSRSRSMSPRSRGGHQYRKVPYRRTMSRSRSRSRYRSPSPTRRRGYSPYRRYKFSTRSPPRRYSPPRRRSPFHRTKSISFNIRSTPSLKNKEEDEERQKKANLKRQVKTYIAALDKELLLKLKNYEKTPEKHPQYSEEWKKFWNRRYKELTTEGKDASKHDFKPEWILYWTTKVKEISEEEKNERIKKYCNELGVPDLNVNDSDEDDEIVEITPANDSEGNGGRNRKVKSYEKVGREDEHPDILFVLSLLTALETQLGSLGPRITSLLTTALALEKQEEGSASQLLNDKEIIVMFETLKEKLKGQLFAGVVPYNMVKGAKKVIAAIVALCSSHEKLRSKPEASLTATPAAQKVVLPVFVPPVTPLVVAGVGAVDKLALAQQIASTLVAQGKTDLTEEDLEQLINAVVGMAQGMVPMASGESDITNTMKSENSSSNLQDLLSSVLKAHTAKASSPSFKLMQLRSEVNSSKPLTLRDMSDLTENDLKTLLQNFKDLSREEQQFLITYLKSLEVSDPLGVEKLRNYIDSGHLPIDNDSMPSERLSPFSSREGGSNPSNNLPSRKSILDDEEDYSFEDICKAAKKNVITEKRKIPGREVAEQMIKEQEKKMQEKKMTEEVKHLAQNSGKGVHINPDDLLSGITPVLEADVVMPPAAEIHNIPISSLPCAPPPRHPIPAEKPLQGGWENYPAYSYEDNSSYNYNQVNHSYQGYGEAYQQPSEGYGDPGQYTYQQPDFNNVPPQYGNAPYGYY